MSTDSPLPTRRPVPDSLFGGRLAGAFLLDLEVVDVGLIAPHVRSLTVASSDLVGFEHTAGQDLMIEFPDGERSVRRRYTIRRADPEAGTAELEFELHGAGGVATSWANSAETGSRLEAIGPRGAAAIRPEAASHFFVADDSAMPAAFAMLEALPYDAQAAAVLVTPHGPSSRPGPVPVCDARLHWVEEAELPEVMAELAVEPSAAAYVNGERRLVARARDLLVAAGMDPSAVAAKAYWRSDQPNAPHGEPPRD